MENRTYSLKNKNNVEVVFMNIGGRILKFFVPDKNGQVADVVLGYDSAELALAGDSYMGSLVGRYANRIVKGEFELDGKEYKLDCNNDKNHLHGGNDGFDKRYWDVEEIKDSRFEQTYKLSLTSANGDQNYPGELVVQVIYGLTSDNQFVIEYEAETTEPTIINLTSHPYFNLKGVGSGTIENHALEIDADKYTPLNKDIGTVDGSIVTVENTPMDFRKSKRVGDVIHTDDEQVEMVEGIDHNFVLNGEVGKVRLAATLVDPDSGRKMEVYTDQPGIQIYIGSHFDKSEIGKDGKPIEKWGGIALETQNYPDAPNQAHFPNCVLRPGEKYKHVCIYKFV